MFDTHVNLHGETYADDLNEVLLRAEQAGVKRMLAICDRFDNFPAVKAIAEGHDRIWCTVGTHPHHAKDFQHVRTADLVEAAISPKVVAIGETGLDYHYGYSPETEQKRSLDVHIEAAQETGLPIVLHTREADPQVMEMLSRTHAKASYTPLLHCYTGGPELAELALSLGGYVSVSGILSFKNAHEVRAVISRIPLERVIVETDCPYLTPMPFRGRRNEPAYLIHVCEALGKLHGLPAETVASITEANARRLFWKVDA